MSDRRLAPDRTLVHEKTRRRVVHACADLCREGNWPRDRQLLYGTEVTQFSVADGFAYVQSDLDGYVGFVPEDRLGEASAATHRIITAGSTVFAEPDFKSQDLLTLFHGSRISVADTLGKFVRTPVGFVPNAHIAPIDRFETDPVAVAELYLGSPYLWGGNTRNGIDCSGLVQAALISCGIACPGDSDLQQTLGQPADGTFLRNDLLFWKGHVALVANPQTIIHANAHAMATVFEPIPTALKRILDQGDGPLIAHRRVL